MLFSLLPFTTLLFGRGYSDDDDHGDDHDDRIRARMPPRVRQVNTESQRESERGEKKFLISTRHVSCLISSFAREKSRSRGPYILRLDGRAGIYARGLPA